MADAVRAHAHSQRMAQALARPVPLYAAASLAVASPRVSRAMVARLDGPPRPTSARELDCLAQAVYFEARGETAEGQAAVAAVVLNRVRHPAFPKTVCAVVFQGCQFSFTCDGSARRGREAGAWSRARKVAARALAGDVLGEVGAATHFHTTAVNPGWGPGMLRVTQVGLHVFYKLSNRPMRAAPKAAPVFEAPQQAVFVSLPAEGPKTQPEPAPIDAVVEAAAPAPAEAAAATDLATDASAS